jgi:glycosyltransferase involved in cell wall biosynthesis
MERAPEAHFVVVGDGPAQSEIKQTFADRHLADRLHLIGEANGNRLRDAYGALDLFVFSSKSETQGMVLVEAMAAGKPVIALDASGSREVIEDGENGRLLSEDAAAEDFAAAIRTYRDSPARMQKWKAGALRTAQHFSRKASAEKMEALYQKLFGSKDGNQTGDFSELDPLEALTDRIKTEWELWRRKTAAA